MKLVITMSRRFGTGASIIASELSERLGVPVYDKAYIEERSTIMNMNLRQKQSANWQKSPVSSSDAVLPIFLKTV